MKLKENWRIKYIWIFLDNTRKLLLVFSGVMMVCGYFLKKHIESSLVAQQVKDLVLSLLWLRLLLWQGFYPWLRKFHIPTKGAARKKEREKHVDEFRDKLSCYWFTFKGFTREFLSWHSGNKSH